MQERLNDFLSQIAATVRTHFGGQVTYASAPWEFVDWRPFDLVGIDAYRACYNADSFREELRGQLAHGKPVAVTEYGTCAYQGAGDRGGPTQPKYQDLRAPGNPRSTAPDHPSGRGAG
ncbi:hypothetical protein [Streptomyces sp. NPDC001020]